MQIVLSFHGYNVLRLILIIEKLFKLCCHKFDRANTFTIYTWQKLDEILYHTICFVPAFIGGSISDYDHKKRHKRDRNRRRSRSRSRDRHRSSRHRHDHRRDRDRDRRDVSLHY